MSSSPPGSPWPMLGRSGEFDELVEALGQGRHAVVHGPAGIGKTRLIREVIHHSGQIWTRIAATAASASVPFGALAPLLPAGVDPLGVTAAVRAGLASDGYIVVDDAHLLDPASAGVVHQLAQSGVTVLATVRSDRSVPDAVTALWKDDRGTRVELRALPGPVVAALLEAVLGGQVDTGAAHQLATRSGGNPMFLRELVRSALDAAVLVRRLGVWTLQGEWALGQRLADLVPLRVEALAGPSRRLVELLALAEPMRLDLIGVLVPEALGAVVESAEEQGLLAVAAEGTEQLVRLGHPLYAEAVRAALPVSRRLRLFGELADALRPTSTVEKLRLGLYQVEAGRSLVPDALLGLSRQARPLDARLARRFARAAVEAGGGVAAGLELANLLAHAQCHDEAEAVLGGLDPSGLSPAERVTVVATRAMSLAFAPQRPQAALVVLDEAADLGPLPMLQTIRSGALMRSARMAEAVELSEGLLRDETMPPPVRLMCAYTATAAHAMMGRHERALAAARLGEQQLAASATDVPEGPLTLRLLAGLALFVGGDLAGEQAAAEASYVEALAARSDGEREQFAQVLGRIAIMRGQPRLAVRRLRETYAGAGLWWDATLPWTRALLTEALVLAGETTAAREVVDAALAAPCAPVYATYVALAAAEVEAAEGSTTAAARRARASGEVADGFGMGWQSTLAWYSAVRHGDLTAVPAALRAASTMDGLFGPAVAAHVQARAVGDGAGLEAAAGMFEAMGAARYAVEARVHAVRAYRAAGRRGPAALATVRLEGLLAGLEPLAGPGLTVDERLDGLTAREAEVAQLAARGLADREIAARLSMSVRTAQTHLARVYAKLGLHDRRDLAAELGPRPTT